MPKDKKPKSIKPKRRIPTRVNRFIGSEKRTDTHLLTGRERKFLEIYAETLDEQLAAKESGLKLDVVRQRHWLLKEIDLCNAMASLSHRNKLATGNHWRLMDKFEKLHDEMDSSDKHEGRLKGQYASSLSRMSETAMRAAGEFSTVKHPLGHNAVQVVINLGASEEDKVETKTIDITPDAE
jgi:hypothetical protein